jgi:hypothetical protein
MKYKFEKDLVGGIILVIIQVDVTYEFKMVLDTGAATTTFDINAMRFGDYPIGNILETRLVETAAGIMEVDVIETKAISAFGHKVDNMKVQIYDYLAHGILSDYDGVLGLDFFENTKFSIDMVEQSIELTIK